MAVWIPVVVAALSALLAGIFALTTKRSELRAQRRLEAESRIATSRSELYQPVIDKIGEMWDRTAAGEEIEGWVEREFRPPFMRLLNWIQIYGSDEAVWAAHRLMQGMYYESPPNVLSRHLADFVIAARKDLATPDTRVSPLDVMGLRVNDIYEHPVWGLGSLAAVYASEGWSPPWGDRFKYGKPHQPR